MANGKNAGRLFADCTNEHGYGEWHAFNKDEDHSEGAIRVCKECGRKFQVTNDGLKPINEEEPRDGQS